MMRMTTDDMLPSVTFAAGIVPGFTPGMMTGFDLQAGKVTNDLNELRACPDRRAGR